MTVQEDKRLTTILQAHSGYFHPPHPQPRTFPLYIAHTTSQEESCHCCAPNAFPQERHVPRFLHLSGKPHHLPEIRQNPPKRNKFPHDSCAYAGNLSPFLAETTEMRIRHPSLPKPLHQTLYLESLSGPNSKMYSPSSFNLPTLIALKFSAEATFSIFFITLSINLYCTDNDTKV